MSLSLVLPSLINSEVRVSESFAAVTWTIGGIRTRTRRDKRLVLFI